jgi:hypothetical protein
MIHFPRPWLDWLKETSFRLNHLPPNFILEKKASGVARISFDVELLEFKIHTSLFSVRKIEESTGVSLGPKNQIFDLPFWPASAQRIHQISRTPNPPLEQWYDLNTAQNKSVSSKVIIDVFIHARICNICWDKELGLEREQSGFRVASDYTMKKYIFFVSFKVLDEILNQAIRVIEPRVLKRELHAKKLSEAS